MQALESISSISSNTNNGKFTPQWIKTNFDMLSNACFLNVQVAHF